MITICSICSIYSMFSDDSFLVFVTSTLFCQQKALVFEIEANGLHECDTLRYRKKHGFCIFYFRFSFCGKVTLPNKSLLLLSF